MARMWRADELDCSRDYIWNARRILGVRIAEVYAHDFTLDDPKDSVGHHNLRISIKRLRYSLEIFAACFDAEEVEAVVTILSTMQDLLGDLHDAEVLVPELQATVDRLDHEEKTEVRILSAEARERGERLSFEAFRRRLDRVHTADARPGLLGLINSLARQRVASYGAAVALWRQLDAEGFRARIERIVGREAEDVDTEPRAVATGLVESDGTASGSDRLG